MTKLTKFFALACICAAASISEAANNIGLGMEGDWYSPQTNGQGAAISYNQRTDGSEDIVVKLFAFTSDSTGDQAWTYSSGSLVGNKAVTKLIAVRGGKFNDEAAAPTVDGSVGSVTVELIDCGTLNVSWYIKAPAIGIVSQGSRQLIRLSSLLQNPNGTYLCSGLPVIATAPACAAPKPQEYSRGTNTLCPEGQVGDVTEHAIFSCVNNTWVEEFVRTGDTCHTPEPTVPNGIRCSAVNPAGFVEYKDVAALRAALGTNNNYCMKIDGIMVIGGFGPCDISSCQTINGYVIPTN